MSTNKAQERRLDAIVAWLTTAADGPGVSERAAGLLVGRHLDLLAERFHEDVAAVGAALLVAEDPEVFASWRATC